MCHVPNVSNPSQYKGEPGIHALQELHLHEITYPKTSRSSDLVSIFIAGHGCPLDFEE